MKKHRLEDKCEVKRKFDKENNIFKRIIKLHIENYGCRNCDGYDTKKICYIKKAIGNEKEIQRIC